MSDDDKPGKADATAADGSTERQADLPARTIRA